MKIILTEGQYEQLTEMIKLDIKVGDTIMGGKFKNKKVVVKTIEKNDKGDITINGKPLLRFRILKENNFHLLRRESMIKKKLDSIIQNRFTNEEFQFMPFEHFRLHISDYVGTEMANELNLTGDKKVTFRNQIIQYVRNNFYEYLKEIWESKQKKIGISENISTSEKNKKFLTKIMGVDFTNKIKQITSTYDVPMEFDEGVGPTTIRMWLNHWGPMYLVNINGKNYLYQDRGDFEMFIDEEGFDFVDNEIPEEIGIGVLGLRFSDIVDMYFEEENQI
jgi:hypothetical protein